MIIFRHFIKPIIFISFCIITGCAVGPDYSRPETSATHSKVYINASESSSALSLNRWWERINDPLLPDYIHRLLEQNIELKEAGARILQARARLGIEKGANYPSVSANTSASRSFSPSNSINGTSSERSYNTSYVAELQASWEIDLFGRISKSVESATATFQASLYDREALTHALVADLVNRRIAIGVNQRLLALAQNNAANRQKIYDLIRKRYDMGARNSDLEDVLLAKENFTTVKADINRFQRILKNEVYAFDILLGQNPGETDIITSVFPILPAPLDVAVCVPASLLDRRPDLKANEFRLVAASANIGVAMADLYPGLNLVGALGFSGDNRSRLFNSDQMTGSIIGSFTARLFEGGRIRANIDLQEAETRELAHAYAGDVLQAIGDVESALQSENELTEEVISLNESVDALKKAEAISQKRYRSGLIPLRDFLDTQQRRYQIEQSAILREQEKWNTRIALYLALGGDWFSKKSNDQQEACH